MEIIPALTLGSLFGTDMSSLPGNWSYWEKSVMSDWVYLWESRDTVRITRTISLDETYEPSMVILEDGGTLETQG